MKKTLLPKFLAAFILLIIATCQFGMSQSLLVENFDYTIGTVLTATTTPDPTTGWQSHSGNGTANIDVTNGLSFDGYAGSNIGGAANVDNNGQDINKPFTAQTSGVVYTAALINIAANTTAGYFFHLGPNVISTTFFSRIWVNATANGINITNSSTAPATYLPVTSGSTFLLVIKHTFSTHTTDLFILNSFSATEPSTPDATITETISEIGSVALRQYSATQHMIVDGIRIGNTWADAVTPGTSNTVSTPTFSPLPGNYYAPVNVSLTTITENATIYYTTNGDEPDQTSTQYTTPIAVTSTTTIKARAYATGYDPSAIATATYIFPVVNDVANIAALYAGTPGTTVYRLTGEAVLTYKTAANNVKYLQDASGAIMIFDASGIITTPYNLYDGITGITGTLTLYNNMLEFVPVINPGVATSSGNTVVPAEVTLADLTTDYQAKLVKVINNTIAGTGNFANATNYTITDPTGTGVLRTAYTDLDYIGQPIPTAAQNLTGVVLQYQTTMQLVPRSLSDFEVYVPVSPTITVTPSALTGFTYITGSGPSAEQSISVSGSSLTDNINISAPTNYEISLTSGSGFTNSLSLTQSGGIVTETSIYVRLKAGLVAGDYNNEIINITSTGAETKTVTCSGTVTPVAPLITVDPATLSGFSYNAGSGPSSEQSFTISGSNLTADILITPPADFEISTGTGASFSASNPITLSPAGGAVANTTIHVRLKAGLAAGSYNNETIIASSTGAIDKTVTCSGTVNPPAASAVVTSRPLYIDLSATTSESAVLMTLSNYSSNDARYRLYNGSNQYNPWDETTDLYVTSTSYASGPSVPGTPVSSTTFWILFQRGSNNTTIASYRDRLGTAYSANYQTVALPAATAITTPFSLTGIFTGVLGYDNTVKHVVLGYSGTSLISAASTTLSTGAFTLVNPAGTTIDKIEIRAIDNTLIASITGSWTAATDVGFIPAASTPVVTVSPITLSGFTYAEGSGPSDTKNFTASGVNLLGNISIAAPVDYEIAEDPGTSFSGSISLVPSSGTVTSTTIHVRLKAGLATGDYNNEVINVTATGAEAKTVTCSGTVTAPSTPEPSNHVTNFTAGTTTITTIPLSWTDATGAVLPDAYLIKGSTTSFEAISAPVDGTPEANSLLVQNVNFGIQNYTFTNLTPETPYYFKIFPYTNSGTAIDYKTDGTVPEATATTLAIPSGVLIYEGFDYTIGSALQTQANWNAVNTGDDIVVSEGSLTYPDLQSSTGNKISFAGTGIDAYRTFYSQTTGTVYFSFLMNVTALGSLNATGGYFTGLATNSTTFGATIWTGLDGTGYKIGINPRTSTTTNMLWVTGTQSIGNTVMIVGSYEFVNGTGNDIVKIWVNPQSSTFGSATPPEATATITNTTGTDLASIGQFFIRQDSDTETPSIEMDEYRVGRNWSEVTPPGVTNKTLNLKAYFEGFVAAREGVPPASGYMYKTQLSDGSTTWDAFAGTVVDTLTVALANEAAPYDIVYYGHNVNLNTDGTMTVTVPSAYSGNYYVVLQHRQYIETWSATAVSFAASTVDYDFSTSASQTYGNNQKSLGAGWGYGLYSGDIVKDGYIELAEVNNAYISARSAQYSYLVFDFTGNGFVELDDVNLIYTNYRSARQRLAPDTVKK